jgi:hypothetical protein
MRAYSIGHGRRVAVPAIAQRKNTMTNTNIINVVDRFALGLLNAMALVGVPLIAIGVLTQTF